MDICYFGYYKDVYCINFGYLKAQFLPYVEKHICAGVKKNTFVAIVASLFSIDITFCGIFAPTIIENNI